MCCKDNSLEKEYKQFIENLKYVLKENLTITCVLWNDGQFRNDFLGVAKITLDEILGKKIYKREYFDDKKSRVIKFQSRIASGRKNLICAGKNNSMSQTTALNYKFWF